jgi:putative two-component system response regulator
MNNSKGTVLAVDDDPAILEGMVSSLGGLGYDVWQAADGESALVLAHEQQPDVILLDLMLPGMDGYTVCRKLKADIDTQLIPVVFLTGHGSREARLKGLEAGANDFLNKPCELTDLEVRVRNLVGFRRLTQELDSAEKMMFTIARIVEARDEGTGDHCDRLAGLTVQLGKRLGLDEADLKALHRGAYLHDLGKIGIPDAILLKPAALSDAEWEIMRRHVDIGVEICAPLRTLKPVLPVIRNHHEKWDGSGYPDGLRGEEIPYLARVFQVVDVFDALSSDRCYRKALPWMAALDVVGQETDAGLWDRAVVKEFVTMIREQHSAHNG